MRFLVARGPSKRTTKPGWATFLADWELVECDGTAWLLFSVEDDKHHDLLQRIPPSWDVRADWREDTLDNHPHPDLRAVGEARKAKVAKAKEP